MDWPDFFKNWGFGFSPVTSVSGHVPFQNDTLSTLLHTNKNKYCDFYSKTHFVGNSQYYWVGFQSCWTLTTHIEILQPCWCPVSSGDLCARARGPGCCNIISLILCSFVSLWNSNSQSVSEWALDREKSTSYSLAFSNHYMPLQRS